MGNVIYNDAGSVKTPVRPPPQGKETVIPKTQESKSTAQDQPQDQLLSNVNDALSNDLLLTFANVSLPEFDLMVMKEMQKLEEEKEAIVEDVKERIEENNLLQSARSSPIKKLNQEENK